MLKFQMRKRHQWIYKNHEGSVPVGSDKYFLHYGIMTWRYFPYYKPFSGESMAAIELLLQRTCSIMQNLVFCFLTDPAVEQTAEMLVIWDALSFIWRNWLVCYIDFLIITSQCHVETFFALRYWKIGLNSNVEVLVGYFKFHSHLL